MKFPDVAFEGPALALGQGLPLPKQWRLGRAGMPVATPCLVRACIGGQAGNVKVCWAWAVYDEQHAQQVASWKCWKGFVSIFYTKGSTISILAVVNRLGVKRVNRRTFGKGLWNSGLQCYTGGSWTLTWQCSMGFGIGCRAGAQHIVSWDY
jgi:hypothetical protein